MNNQERIKARIERDKQRRAVKRAARAEQYGRIDKVVTMQHLFKSFLKRKKGTDWKQSVMDFCFHAIVKIKRLKDSVLAGVLPEPSRIQEIFLYERGKRRRVHAVVIDSRVIQGCVCDYCITPLTQPGLINANPASTAGKGVSWARKQIIKDLRRAFKKMGADACAIITDLQGFFDSIRHDVCERIFRYVQMDDMLTALAMHFIKMYQVFEARKIEDDAERNAMLARLERNEGVGASLGSQVSQNMALCTPNDLDHTVKDRCGTREYMRYMDDGYALGTKEALFALEKKISEVCAKLGFKLHEKKTQIMKLSKGFTYLKIRYQVTETGRIIKRTAHSGIVRIRRKLKKLRGLVNQGKITLDDAFSSVMSWIGNAKHYTQSFRTRKAVIAQYYRLFMGYRMEGART